MNLDAQINDLKKIKDQIKSLNTEVTELKEREDEIARDLMTEMGNAGLKRMANEVATLSVATESVPNVDDWDLFYKYISDNGSFELLHKRVSSRAWSELSKTEVIPGVASRDLTKLNFRSL